MKKLFYLLMISFLVLSCDRPRDQVCVGRTVMVIYTVEPHPTKSKIPSQGTYCYWVNDATDKGWMFSSFNKYSKGDTVEIVVHHKK